MEFDNIFKCFRSKIKNSAAKNSHQTSNISSQALGMPTWFNYLIKMRRIFERIGFILLGAAIASVLFLILAYPHVRDKWRDIGYNSGRMRASVDMYRTLSGHFKENYDDCKFVAVVAVAKPEQIKIVDCGSFKSLSTTEE